MMKRRICILLVTVMLSLVLCPALQAAAASNPYFEATVDGIGYYFYYLDEDVTSDKVMAFVKKASKPNVTGNFVLPSTVEYDNKQYTVVKVDAGGFNGCTNLTGITLPVTVTEIVQQAFGGCTSLETVTINGKITKIGAAAFSGCTSLRSINLPDSLSSIADSSFYNCGFTSLTIPGNLTMIPGSAFKSCTKLETLTLEEGVKTLAVNGPFASCTSLKTIYLPSTIMYIQAGAFQNCSAITDVYYNGSDADKAGITIYASNNTYLTNATWHYPFATVTVADIIDQEYIGSAVEPELTVTSAAGTALVKDTDYTTSWKNNIMPGKATVTLTGKGSYHGSKSATFSIIGNIGEASIAAIEDQAYTGSALKPKPTVTFAGKTLTEGTDYTLSWANNTDIGTATVTVTGKGYYAGTTSANFAILKNIAEASIASIKNQTWTGSALKPKPTVTLDGKTLAEGTDYTVSWKDNTAVGTATVTVTGKGNYAGTKSASFKIIGNLSEGTIAAIKNQTWTGSALKPKLKVTFNNKTLKEGTDYTLSWKNNTNVGTATVTVTGKGNYTGTKSATFKIVGKIVGSSIAAIKDQPWTGKAIKPKLTVKLGGKTLKEGTDYTVSWKNNTAVGKATVTVTGKGNYTGKVIATFKIVGDLSGATVTAIKEQACTGSEIKPTVTVTFAGKKLKRGTDYTLSWNDNKDPGQATVTVTGKGNYTGTKTANFIILPKQVKLSSLKAGKKQLTVKWKKSTGIVGYEIEYSLKKDFKSSKTVTITDAKAKKTVIKKLKGNKTYYVRIRSYFEIGGVKYYSPWSKVLHKKVKK